MRVAAAIGLGLFAVGAALTWATDWNVVGADGDAVGAILMIAGGVGLLALIVFSVSRNASADGGLESSEPVDEPSDRFTAGWPRR
jgi:hypothetical protein